MHNVYTDPFASSHTLRPLSQASLQGMGRRRRQQRNRFGRYKAETETASAFLPEMDQQSLGEPKKSLIEIFNEKGKIQQAFDSPLKRPRMGSMSRLYPIRTRPSTRSRHRQEKPAQIYGCGASVDDNSSVEHQRIEHQNQPSCELAQSLIIDANKVIRSRQPLQKTQSRVLPNQAASKRKSLKKQPPGSVQLPKRDYPVELNLHPNFIMIGKKNSIIPANPRVRILQKAERMTNLVKKYLAHEVMIRKQQNFTKMLLSGQSLPPEDISKLDPLQKALYLNRMLMMEHQAEKSINQQRKVAEEAHSALGMPSHREGGSDADLKDSLEEPRHGVEIESQASSSSPPSEQ